MKKTLFIGCLLIGFIWIPFNSIGQLQQYNFSQLDSLQQMEKKPLIVFIHTNWCSYCAAMSNTTLKNRELVKEINDRFYFISLNAEQPDDISFNGKLFKFRTTGKDLGYHELASYFATVNNQTNFPTICFISEENQVAYRQTEFISAKKMKLLIGELLAKGK